MAIMSDPISELTKLVLKFREERDWAQFHNPKDVAISLTLEAAELLELTQWKNGKELEDHLAKNREALSDELADIFGWVLVLAHDQKIDLAEALRRKLVKNAQKYPIEKARGEVHGNDNVRAHLLDCFGGNIVKHAAIYQQSAIALDRGKDTRNGHCGAESGRQ